jgi:D-alanine-D-alanine ligase
MKIGVIYGGVSSEREISIKTGTGVIRALQEKQYNVVPIFFSDNRELVKRLADIEVDAVYIALHGRYGEDGTVQGLLELLDIPYVGSNVLSSALAMAKHKAKESFRAAGLNAAEELIIQRESFQESHLHAIPFSFPRVVKPSRDGSTIGVSIVGDEQEQREAIGLAFQYDETVIIEQFIAGVEVTVGVIGHGENVEALPVIEIVPKTKFYDFEAKYKPGMSEHIIPARLSPELLLACQQAAIKAHLSLGCETYSRVDFIVDQSNSLPVILELNTLPGMTETSLFPDAARSIGLSYADMIDKLIQLSIIKKKGANEGYQIPISNR